MFKPVLFKLWKFKPHNVQTSLGSNNYIDQTTDYYISISLNSSSNCTGTATTATTWPRSCCASCCSMLSLVPPVPRPVSPSRIVPRHGALLSCRGAWHGAMCGGAWCVVVWCGAWCVVVWRGAACSFRLLDVAWCGVRAWQGVACGGVVRVWQGVVCGGVV